MFTIPLSLLYLHLMRNNMPWLFLMNTVTFMKRIWLGRLEKGYKQMFSQSCWNRKVKEIALFLKSLSNRRNHFILGKFRQIFLYHFGGEILTWLDLQHMSNSCCSLFFIDYDVLWVYSGLLHHVSKYFICFHVKYYFFSM